MRAFTAILIDIYRELSSKRLFWLSLGLSTVVVAAFAMVGINEKGMTIFGILLEIPFVNSTVLEPGEFYKLVFYALGVRFWLAWLACLLALVASAGLFPELVSSGTVETLLSKPILRYQLYLSKFVGGLLFTALQITMFCLASFVVIGVRGDAWEPGVFLAIPLVTLLYSYLFAISALIGTVTRSGIAALLLTVLIWGFLFSLNLSEMLVNSFRIAQIEEIAAIDRLVATQREKDVAVDTSDLTLEREEAVSTLATLSKAHQILFITKSILPKTEETAQLLQRWTVHAANLEAAAADDEDETQSKRSRRRGDRNFGTTRARERDVTAAIERDQHGRSLWWVVGTSLAFEAAVLAWGCRVFSRRDF